MPKLKTKSAVKRRFKLTGTGKIKRTQAGTGHLLSNKAHKNKRNLRGTTMVSVAEEKNVKRCALRKHK